MRVERDGAVREPRGCREVLEPRSFLDPRLGLEFLQRLLLGHLHLVIDSRAGESGGAMAARFGFLAVREDARHAGSHLLDPRGGAARVVGSRPRLDAASAPRRSHHPGRRFGEGAENRASR